MPQKHNPGQMLEDLGQVVSALFGTLLSGRGQMRDQAKQKIDMALQRLPFVSREEYDALHGMLQRARLDQDALKTRLDALERGEAKSAAAVKPAFKQKVKNRQGLAKKSATVRRGGKRG